MKTFVSLDWASKGKVTVHSELSLKYLKTIISIDPGASKEWHVSFVDRPKIYCLFQSIDVSHTRNVSPNKIYNNRI